MSFNDLGNTPEQQKSLDRLCEEHDAHQAAKHPVSANLIHAIDQLQRQEALDYATKMGMRQEYLDSQK